MSSAVVFERDDAIVTPMLSKPQTLSKPETRNPT